LHYRLKFHILRIYGLFSLCDLAIKVLKSIKFECAGRLISIDVRNVIRKILLIFLLVASFVFVQNGAVASAEDRTLKIVSIISNSETPYDIPLAVDIVVAHDSNRIPVVAVYYAVFLNRTVQSGGWRFVGADLSYRVTGYDVSVFTARIPSPVYDETLPYDTKIVFYVEAVDGDTSVLSCRQEDRWNASVQDDKLVFVLTDPYPPEILGTEFLPSEPRSDEEVTVMANVTDGKLGAGIEKVDLFFSIDRGRSWSDVRMEFTEGILYEGTLPKYAKDTEVLFYIKAWDSVGNSAKGNQTRYKVQTSLAEKQLFEQILLIAFLMPVVVFGLVAVKYRETVRRYTRVRAAMLWTLAATLVIVGWLFYVFAASGRWLWPLFLGLVMIEVWSIVDPRVRGVIIGLIKPTSEYLTRVFEENPPTVLIATCYALGFAGAVAVAILAYTGRYTLMQAYNTANLIASYIFFLLAAGVVGQLIWIIYKKEERNDRVPVSE